MEALRDELDAANKTVDRYVRLVASLSEELDNLRKSICHNCKNKYVPSYGPVAASASSVGAASSPSLWRRIVGRLPPVLPTNVGPPILHITAQQNQANSTILAPPETLSSTIPKLPSTTHVDAVQSEAPGCIVSHNPEIKQALRIDLVKTLNFMRVVFCVKFSPDGKYLAIGQAGGRTCIYDVEKGLNICSFVDLYLKDQPLVWSVQFSPDNKCIGVASETGIRIWDVARKRTRAAFWCFATSLCFSPNGRFFVACEGIALRIRSLRDSSCKTLLDGFTTTLSIVFSPDGRHIAAVNFNDGSLWIWGARKGQLLDTWKGHTHGRCVVFTPDGSGLVSGGEDGILKYWDVSSLADMAIGRDRVIGGTSGQRFQQIRKFEGHSALVSSVSFSSDHKWVGTSSGDRSIRIWNPLTAECQCTLHGPKLYVRSVDFSPDGKHLASGGDDRKVILWRYKSV